MRQLSVYVSEGFEDLDKLIEEIEDLGHRVIRRIEKDNNNDIDYFIFENKPSFNEFSNNNSQDINKSVLCLDNKIVLCKDKTTGFLIEESDQDIIDNDLVIDAIISLSQDKNSHQFKEITIELNTFSGTEQALSEAEYNKIVYEWNQTDKEYPKDKTIYQLFQEQVERTPKNVAVVYENKKLTYTELNERSNQLARYLRSQIEIKPDTLIAFCLDRSLEMIIGILGIMKAGGAHVPIDPEYPAERINYILEDTQTQLVLTQSHLNDKLREITKQDKPNKTLINLDSDCCYNQGKNNLPIQNKATDLAYVIYTSGTTGNPKGVMNTHGNIVSLVSNDFIKVTENDSFAFLSSPVFDASVFEIWMPLSYGARLVIPFDIKELVSTSNKFISFLGHNDINILWLTKTLFNTIFINTNTSFKNIKYLLIGGEALDVDIINKLIAIENKPEYILNGYGPTEGTTFSSTYLIKGVVTNNSVPIGKSLNNRFSYVLDQNNKPVPIGVIGELHIGGAGLARGYLNRPELTSQNFIPNPFTIEEGVKKGYTRLYKTGDLVRWLPDGNLEYIGRNDDQVKIRGYRIELGEIENILLNIKGIKQSSVLANENKTDDSSDKYLVGFYVLDKTKVNSIDTSLTLDFILEKLSSTLPDYMVPSILIEVDSFPLTINGKLDKLKLFEQFKLAQTQETIFSPSNKYEKFLGELWLSILPTRPKELNSESNYLALGGHSLLLTKIIISVMKAFNISLKPSDIFEHITLGQLSKHIEMKLQSNEIIESIPELDFSFEKQDDNNDLFELTDVQEAYYLGRSDIFQLGGISTHIYLELVLSQLDVEKFQTAINKTVNRHSALRTVFDNHKQRTLTTIPEFKVLSGKRLQLRSEMSHHVFDLETYPLFDFKYSIEGNKYVLHCSFDAIITDVFSLSIIFKDISSYYQGQSPDQLEINYKDYIYYNLKQQGTQKFLKDKQYWENKLPSMPDYPQIPLTKEINQVKNIKFANLKYYLSEEKVTKLKKKSSAYGISLTTVFLYCYASALSRYSNNQDVLLNLTLFNRDYIHSDIDKIVGDFTTLEVFSFSKEPNSLALTDLKRCQKELWDDLDHKLYTGLQVTRDIRKYFAYDPDRLIAPYVFTSALGHSMFADDFMQGAYEKVDYESAQTSQCILDNIIREEGSDVRIDWYYIEQLFAPELIKQIHTDYCHLIENLVELNWNGILPEIALSDKDQNVIAKANSATQAEVTQTLVDICLPSIVSEDDKTNVAVIDNNGSYTYGEIEAYSYNISNYLLDLDLAKPNQLIAVLSEKGYQQVVATLGIMQSGAAYLPLHVDWPRGRVDDVLKEGLVSTVLVSRSEFNGCIKAREIESKYEWVIIEEIVNDQSKKTDRTKITQNKLPKVSLDDIAYVIFTSGSTGKPKGVTISHRNAVNTIAAINHKFKVNKEDKVLALSELSFDLSVYDIFGVLASGATIIFPDQLRTKEPCHWYDLIHKHQISIWDTVPQLMQLLVDFVNGKSKALDSLKVVLMSGDWIPTSLPSQIKQLNHDTTVMSLGGATEGSIWSIWYEVKEIQPDWKSIPYGYALPNQKMYVLNRFGEHCPIGVNGEIHIGGTGVAQGYWNDKEKTNASFIEHNTLGRLYKTGDLGKWNRNGYIEFQGRKDTQVKLNGYRVELEEISAHLMKFNGIDEALTKVQDNRLIAYLVAPSFKSQTENLDTQSFKLAQHGIRHDLSTSKTHSLISSIDETHYRLRKSYRQFINKNTTLEMLSELVIPTELSFAKKNLNIKQQNESINLNDLSQILKPLSAVVLEDKVLPKYLYPSSGSSYAVQAYLVVPDSKVDGLAAGEYYYHPLKQELQNTGIGIEPSVKSASLQLEFKLYLPAIEPLYGNDFLRLAYLEMGHILYLLEKNLAKTGMDYQVVVQEPLNNIDGENQNYHQLLTISFDSEIKPENTTSAFSSIIPSTPITSISKQLLLNNSGCFNSANREFNLNDKSIVMQTSEFGQLLSNAGGLLVFEGEHNPQNYIQAGFEAQAISEKWYAEDIGSCTIGMPPYDQAIYALAIGSIDKEMRSEAESQTSAVSLGKYIADQLKSRLPNYMIPVAYISLEKLPLTANGKVDYKALPLPEFTSEDEYIAPETQLEKTIATIWQEILKVDRVGVNDDFFRIGGNSILAIKVTHRLSTEIGKQVKVADLFTHKTIAVLSDLFSESESNIVIPQLKQQKALLSFAQERFWFIEKYEQGTNAYNIPTCLKLYKNHDIEAVKYALQAIAQRHEILRTVYFQDENGLDYQCITDQKLVVQEVDINENQLDEYLLAEVNRHFNLKQELSIRVVIYSTQLNYYVLMTTHHIAFDGWSSEIFTKELNQFYNHYVNQQPITLPRLSIQYADFTVWQREYLQGNILDVQIKYWQEKLTNVKPLAFPTDYTRPAQINYQGDSVDFSLDEKTSSRLRKLANEQSVTLYTLLLSGFYLLLNKYTNQEDIVIGTLIANRHYSQIESLLGTFVNTLAIRQNICSQDKIKDLIQNINSSLIEAQAHQDLPFEKLVDSLSIERDQSCHPLFQIGFIVQDFTDENNQFEFYNASKLLKISRFDLDVSISDKGKQLSGKLTYATSLFKRDTIVRVVSHYINILKQLVQTTDKSVKDYQILTANEYQQIVIDWNKTDKIYPKNKTVYQLFQEQVEQTPNNIAVVFEEQKLTYRELNERSNQLARYLRSQTEIKPDTLIALCLDKSLEMIIGILAIMKAGAAYVPIDPEYPAERINYILEDTQTQIILTQAHLNDRLSKATKENNQNPKNKIKVNLINLDSNCYETKGTTNLPVKNKSTDLAYIIYTSGTTGKPKGTCLSHKSLNNLVINQIDKFNIKEKDNVLKFASLIFDASISEIFTSTVSGACLNIIAEEGRKSSELFLDYLVKSKINVATLPPVFLSALEYRELKELKTLVVAGESCSEGLMQKWSKGRRFINAYGPTENTVCATMYEYTYGDIVTNIGKPLNNIKCYVLDKNSQPVPIGVIGELHIGGAGLARGYLNKPELTAQKFIPNPFATEEDKRQGRTRLYKTGDLVRWLLDGNLEYIGRNDFQVKIRGYRIELGEIENVLTKHENISQACVIAKSNDKNDADIHLIAYCVINNEPCEKDISPDEGSAELVEDWEELYENTYEGNIEKLNTFDISGWDSSFTGEPIPEIGMHEWVNETVARICTYIPGNILEVGCGSGLLLYPLVGKCESYTGIDFSHHTIDRLQSSFKELSINNANVAVGYANKLDEINLDDKNNVVDTIIINSVAQYFPNQAYLDEVITQSLSKINSGKIILGDIRDYRLLNAFQVAVERYKAEQGENDACNLDWPGIKRAALSNIKRERELLIAPWYFIKLTDKHSTIKHVEILPKRGIAPHEMNRYRYDVVLHVESNEEEFKHNRIEPDWIDYGEEINLQALLANKNSNKNKTIFGIKAYPNRRVWPDVCIQELLFETQDKDINESDLDAIKQKSENIFGLEDISKLASQYGYKLYAHLNLENKKSEKYYDLVFYDINNISEQYFIVDIEQARDDEFCNNPQKASTHKRYGFSGVRKYLENSLPDYMVPSAFVEIEHFPLTINGKLDRKALPDPELINEETYVAPSTDLEIKLCKVWQKVLTLEKIGITDDFFRIGGNSILAIKLSHQISKSLNVHIAVADIFKYKTVSSLSSYLNSVEGSTAKQIKIIPQELGRYPLSFAQERLWFIEQYEQGTNAYHIPLLLELNEDTNQDRLKQVIQQIIQRHEILRTVFNQNENDGEYYQIIVNDELEVNEFYDTGPDEISLSQQINRDINTPFNLEQGFPIRVSFYHKEGIENKNNKKSTTYLLINTHHIASDGWSIDILLKELNQLYYAQEDNNRDKSLYSLPVLDIQYKDFAYWQKNYLQGEILEKQLSYWQAKLKGYEPLFLATDHTRPKQIDYTGNDVLFKFNAGLSHKLRKLSKDQGCSLYTTLLSGFYILLSKYTSQDDIVLGTPIANRHYAQIQNLIGFFVNSLALRENINQEVTIEEFITQVQNNLIEAQRHQDLPFEKILEELKVEQDTSRHPIFQVMFSVQSFGMAESKLFKPVEQSQYTSNYAVAKYDLTCFMDDSQEEIQGIFNYATALYNQETIERITHHYQLILEQMVENKESKNNKTKLKAIKDYQILTKAEYQQIVIDWNKTDKAYPKDKTIYQLFQEQVEQTPNNIAVVFEEQQLTYRELNERSNQLARHLRSQAEIKPDTLIALCLDRSLEMIIGILAIMKAGAAYVPIDPEYPAERINYVLEDTQTQLILTQTHLNGKLSKITKENKQGIKDKIKVQLINLNSDSNYYEAKDTTNLPVKNKSTDLAYIIYTSGTTGKPKGIMVEHEQFASFILNFAKQPFMKSLDNFNVLCLTSYVFDIFGLEYALPLLFGSRVYISDFMNINNCHLEQSSIIQQTPSVMSAVCDNHKDNLHDKLCLVGGENLPTIVSTQLLNTFNNVINVYGPAESVIWSSSYVLSIDNDVLIGNPLFNETVYVLDKNSQMVPTGIIGELHIGGVGLSRGYLNKPELTAQKFIPNPFATEDDKKQGKTRLYKTGDLVRWLPEGNLEYIGRNDFQVKIRGYRIELGEIENALSSIEGIKQACVLAKDTTNNASNKQSNKYLVAYYIVDSNLKNNIEVNIEFILEKLSEQLPDYMLPSALVQLDKFPLTTNGKLDRKALPNPELADENNYVAPSTDIEIKLCKTWQEVLGLDKVGIIDDFFKIGGDSILSIQLSSRLKKQDLSCSVRDIFDHRTIQTLAKFITSNINQIEIVAEQGILTGQFGLLPVQQWFFAKIQSKGFKRFNHWNQSFLVKVPKLKIPKLQLIVEKLTAQHDILRTHFSLSDRHQTQTYLKHIEIPQVNYLNIHGLSGGDIAKELTKLQSNFNIHTGPLWKIAYIEGYADNSARLYFALHHLIVDAVSRRILIEDFQSLYNQEKLGNKTSSYRQWVNEVSVYAKTQIKEKVYWNNLLESIPRYNTIETEETISFGRTLLNKDLTKILLQQANKAYYTEVNDLLLTALTISLQDWNKESIQGITLEGHGREHLNEIIDHSKTVGWFTTMYPVKLEVQASLASSIKTIKESLRAVPNKGIGFGAFATSKEINPSYSFNDLPPISFNYLGQFDSQDEYWQVVAESSGVGMHQDNEDSNIININGMVVEGELSFSVETRLGKEITEKFATNLQHNLEAITIHCQEIIKANKTQYTPSDFDFFISQESLNGIQQEVQKKHNQVTDIYPATNFQRELMYFNRINPDYQIEQLCFKLTGTFKLQAFKEAWERAYKKYDILRAGFYDDFSPGHPFVVIHKEIKLPLTILDWKDKSPSQCDKLLEKCMQHDRKLTSDFKAPNLIKLTLSKLDNNHYYFIFTNNHILYDGWSMQIFFAEIIQDYERILNFQSLPSIIPKSFKPFSDYTHNKFDKIKAKIFWRNYLDGCNPNIRLQPNAPQKTNLPFRVKIISHFFSKTETKLFDSVVRESGYTLNHICLLAWGYTLAQKTETKDVVFGTTMSYRPAEIESVTELVGLFVATPPVRIKCNASVQQLLKKMSNSQQDRYEHGLLDLNHYDKKWRPSALFSTLYVFQNFPKQEENPNLSLNYEFICMSSGSNHQMVAQSFPGDKLELKLLFDLQKVSLTLAQDFLEGFRLNALNIIRSLQNSSSMTTEGYEFKNNMQ